MTIIALDYGAKKLGVAVGYLENQVTNTLGIISKTKDRRELDQIAKLCQQWQAGRIVIGLALNSKLEETISSKQAKQFAKSLATYLKQNNLAIPIEFFDERHSTKLSNQGLSPRLKQEQGDAYAAEYILQGYLATC